MYISLQPQQSFFIKFYRHLYPIITISLLNYTMSNTYSLMTNSQQSTGFISIIISSLVCFVLSESHLTIYGVSVLSIVYINMIKLSYSKQEIYVITFLAGILQMPFWSIIHSIGEIFHYLPGKIHAGMVLGIGFIILAKFFPLAIENIPAFYDRDQSLLSDPVNTFFVIFNKFNIYTLIYTILFITLLFLFRQKLSRVPSILILVIIGILINMYHSFSTYHTLCQYKDVDCQFYLIKLKNAVIPRLEQLIYLLPASSILTAVLVFQQFLYLEEFQRRGRKHKGEGDLGDIKKQTKVLCIANILCGILGGFPVCINLFATYQNYSFTKKYNFRGTKVVGVSQIIVNYLLYSLLKPLYDMIPLFIIFCVIMIPMIYFFKKVYVFYRNDLKLITCLGLLNVLTHPVFALVIGAFYTIYELAMLLKLAPAQIMIETNAGDVSIRESTTMDKLQQQGKFDQYYSKIIAIDDDVPNITQDFILYRFTGSISYLNFFLHRDEIFKIMYHQPRGNLESKQLYTNILFSFRYVQNIDDEAMEQFSILLKDIKQLNRKQKIILTGLHSSLLNKFKQTAFLVKMLEEEQHCCMYRLHGRDIK